LFSTEYFSKLGVDLEEFISTFIVLSFAPEVVISELIEEI
jgi:hypothetical protein